MAFGCCACAMKVFRTADNEVDEARLAPVLDKLRESGGTDEEVQTVRTCNCGCHVDGQCVMC